MAVGALPRCRLASAQGEPRGELSRATDEAVAGTSRRTRPGDRAGPAAVGRFVKPAAAVNLASIKGDLRVAACIPSIGQRSFRRNAAAIDKRHGGTQDLRRT